MKSLSQSPVLQSSFFVNKPVAIVRVCFLARSFVMSLNYPTGLTFTLRTGRLLMQYSGQIRMIDNFQICVSLCGGLSKRQSTVGRPSVGLHLQTSTIVTLSSSCDREEPVTSHSSPDITCILVSHLCRNVLCSNKCNS